MGIYVSMSFDGVRMHTSRTREFWEIVERTNKLRERTKYMYGRLVDPEIVKTRDVVAAFADMGYESDLDGEWYEITGFLGEKLHDQEEDWTVIAPVIDRGEIECDADSDRWKWKFIGGCLMIVIGEWIWEDEGTVRIHNIKEES